MADIADPLARAKAQRDGARIYGDDLAISQFFDDKRVDERYGQAIA